MVMDKTTLERLKVAKDGKVGKFELEADVLPYSLVKQRYMAKSVGEKHKKLFKRIFDGEATKRDAIRGKCYDCTGFENSHAQIGHCTVTTCALWNFRPIRCSKQDDECDKLG